MKNRIIFGNGKVANIIKKPDDIIVMREECDITDLAQVISIFQKHKPGVIINCAAKTNLEWCQDNKLATYQVNTVGVINLLKACADYDTKFVHISSGCLFDGNEKLSTEKTQPTPSVWYTWTKAWADQYIQEFGYANYLILRPRQLISALSHPTNMLTKFSTFDEIGGIDEANSITCIEDFAEMIDHLLHEDARGIFNCCNSGTLTPYEIACSVRDYIAPNMSVKKISYQQLLDKLPNRRVNTVLCIEKLRATGYSPRSAKDALNWCLENYSE